MKRVIGLLLGIGLIISGLPAAYAETTVTTTTNAAKADIAIKALENKYAVDTSVITDLHSKGRGFGDINLVLALASELPRGVTASNITRVEGLRYGTTVKGWGQVAHELNLNLGSAIRHAAATASARWRRDEQRRAGRPGAGTGPQ